jgi:mevalonate kinase
LSTALAPSKIIISGEHFVVEGAPALVAAINLYVEVSAEERYDNHLRIETDYEGKKFVIKSTLNEKILDTAGGEKAKKFLRPVLRTIRKTFEFIEKSEGMNVYIYSKIPPSSGLGSSAAVFVATSASVCKRLTGLIDKEIVWKAAFEGERLVHKAPSGVDITISTYGGMLLYRKGEKPIMLQKSGKAIFLIATVGKRVPTGKIVERVLKLKSEFPSIINPIYMSANYLPIKIAEFLRKDDLYNAGRLININHELLSAVGVSTPRLDFFVNLSRRKGAYGSKLTGAGGGGAFFALVDDERKTKVFNSLSKRLKDVFEVTIVDEGVN